MTKTIKINPPISFHQTSGIKLKEINDSIKAIKDKLDKYYDKNSKVTKKCGEANRVILELRVEMEKLLFFDYEKGHLSDNYKSNIYFGNTDIKTE